MLGAVRFVLTGMIFALFVVGCEKETTINYEVTPTFVSEAEDFVGIEGKVGFLNNNFKENEFEKTVWHFWGESDEIKGVVRVEGTHLETGEKFPILLNGPNLKNATWEFNNGFTQPNLGATKTMPSYVGFEKSGLWEVSVYLNNNHLGEFILEVK
ncbi:DUF4871 domain-containing protein [Bacillus sp. FJAT-29790]|uniref:DUF4871 domain-containing protein n=1 Tax=Bacillus sp. FJAT-29790 TaxID=1895002 RepID=UPI001C224088|nr:DUF4871 domain-containing protein [Bacillus sp. FJAT-29790]MBU8880084.1 DUF4871 domain-containing protein [Bacillus sp. FJAT-29790]